MPSYYETVDGVKCDKGVIDACREAVEGKGDGRVSVEDATKVLKEVVDGGKVTRCERWTIRYCLTEFKWTEAAVEYFNEAVKKCPGGDEGGEAEEPATKKAKTENYYETIDGMKLDNDIITACREAVKGQGDGRVSTDDAKKVFEKAADSNIVTRCERWTIRYCMTEFNWTEAALDYFLEAVKKVPQEDN